jgi:hypothetical protein
MEEKLKLSIQNSETELKSQVDLYNSLIQKKSQIEKQISESMEQVIRRDAALKALQALQREVLGESNT